MKEPYIKEKIDEAKNRIPEWVLIKEETLEEEINIWKIDLGNEYKEIEIRLDYQPFSVQKPGEIMLSINNSSRIKSRSNRRS